MSRKDAMMNYLKTLFVPSKREKGLQSMEAITLVYILVTGVALALLWSQLRDAQSMLLLRLGVVVGMAALIGLYHLWPARLMWLLRMTFCMVLLIAWYPETYEFCRLLDYQDHLFATADWTLFGCQPALEFSHVLDSAFWAEAFCLGYYSYYYLMAAVMLFYFFARYPQWQWATFVYLSSFFLFYIIYELLPVGGPQYYFQALGMEQASQGIYPPLHDYLAHHTEALAIRPQGVWSQLVVGAQEVGERPTAAFPSSHVGMTVVSLWLAWKSRNRWLFWVLIPFSLLLFCGTVYIKAHYLVDSIAGLLFGTAFFFLFSKLYPYLRKPLHLKD